MEPVDLDRMARLAEVDSIVGAVRDLILEGNQEAANSFLLDAAAGRKWERRFVSQLAYQLARAGRADEAAVLLMAAADVALRDERPIFALAYLQTALRISPASSFDVMVKIAEIYELCGLPNEAARLREEAARLANRT